MAGRFDFLEIPGGGKRPPPHVAPVAAPVVPPPTVVPTPDFVILPPALPATARSYAPQRLELVEVIGGPGAELGQFNRPCGVCVAPDGGIFVADTGNHRVQKITPDGKVIGLGGAGSPDVQLFHNPVGVTTDALGNLFVLCQNGLISKFGPAGLRHTTFGMTGRQLGQLDGPLGLALDEFHNLWVADTGNSRVQIFTPRGRAERVFGNSRSLAQPLQKPHGVCLGAGAVYVADTANHTVVRFDRAGNAEYALGSSGTRVGELSWPVAVAVDTGDHLYVVEAYNHRVQLFPCDDQPRVLWDRGSHPTLKLDTPRALALAADGSVYVCDTGCHRLVRLQCR